MYQETEATLQRKSHLCIPFLGIVRPQSQFPHSCVYEPFIYSQDRSPYFPAAEKGRSIVGIYKSLTYTWMWKLGLGHANSFCWEYLFRIFGMVSLQCTQDGALALFLKLTPMKKVVKKSHPTGSLRIWFDIPRTSWTGPPPPQSWAPRGPGLWRWRIDLAIPGFSAACKI